MTERIRELMEQAGIQELPIEDNDPDYCGKIEDIERFVALIVLECVSICREKERANLYGVREVETAIKEHFGVEE